MGKYDPLQAFLAQAGERSVELTFEEIAAMVGGLPSSATEHQAWWSNEAPGGRHVQARAWLSTGRRVESVDQATGRVRFAAPLVTRRSY